MSEMSTNDRDVFKDVFKFYKRRDRPLDLSKVVDFRDPEKWKDRIRIEEVQLSSVENGSQFDESDSNSFEAEDLLNPEVWKIYKLLPEENSSAGDGIFYICNPFSDSGK